MIRIDGELRYSKCDSVNGEEVLNSMVDFVLLSFAILDFL